MVQFLTANDQAIKIASNLVKEGDLVAFPTETVYGLGADATNDKAVAKIFEAKGRPQFNPLIVHVTGLKMASNYVEIDERAKSLASVFWPGPLTFVLPRKEKTELSLLVSAGLDTVAVRAPANTIAQKLIKETGVPIAAPSANRSGTLSPTTPEHVLDSLGDNLGLILAGGKCQVGLESTVLDLSTKVPALLRAGAISPEEIEDVIGPIEIWTEVSNETPKCPGQLLKHYAPNTPLRLNAIDLEPEEALLAFGDIKFMGVKGGGAAKDLPSEMYMNLSLTGDLTEAAGNLFLMLHALDRGNFKRIAVMSIPEHGIGVAINDRLKRAASSP